MLEVFQGCSNSVVRRCLREWEFLGEENNGRASSGTLCGRDVDLVVAIVVHGRTDVPAVNSMV